VLPEGAREARPFLEAVWLHFATFWVQRQMPQKRPAKGAREARPFLEAVLLHFVIFWGSFR